MTNSNLWGDMVKTLIINGSPRINGDTASLLDVVKENIEGGYRVRIGNRWYADKKKLEKWLENNTVRKRCLCCKWTTQVFLWTEQGIQHIETVERIKVLW